MAQFVSINARFVDDRDRQSWTGVVSTTTDADTIHDPEIAGQPARSFWARVAIFAIGLTTSGYVLGDGLRRSKMADTDGYRPRRLERKSPPTLATWSVDFYHQEGSRAGAAVGRRPGAKRPRLFQRAGFRPEDIAEAMSA